MAEVVEPDRLRQLGHREQRFERPVDDVPLVERNAERRREDQVEVPVGCTRP